MMISIALLILNNDNVDNNSFPIGSFVLVRYADTKWGRGPPTKFDSMWHGPYRVVSTKPNYVQLQDLVNQKLKYVHIKLVKQYNYTANQGTSPAQAALIDKQMSLVERVISHSGDINIKDHLKDNSVRFLVKWQGYVEPTDGQYWTNLRNNEHLHKYLAQNGLHKHIPTAWRKDYTIKKASRSRK